MNKPFFFQVAVKTVENANQSNDVVIEGFASTPDIDRYQDIVEPTAFQNALTMYMKNPVLLYQHDADRPVGVVTSAIVTDKGLKIRAEIKDEDTRAKVMDGRMRAMSIGYIPLETELQHQDGTPFNWETDSMWDADIVRVIKVLDLVEISIVTTPANGNALFSVAKSVKQYFNEVVMKSLKMAKKAEEPEVKPVETAPEETKPEEAKPEEKTEEGKETEPVKPEDKPKEDEELKEDAEKPAETAGADGGEGGEEPAEVPKAEAEPEGAETPKEDVGTPKMDEETAKSFPELVEAGLVTIDAKAQEISPSVRSLLRKLCDAYVAEAKRAEDLQARLEKMPEKNALVVQGQFTVEDPKGEKPKENSPYFKQLFKLN